MFEGSSKIQNCYGQEQLNQLSESENKINYEGSLQNGQITQFYCKKMKQLEIALSLIIAINIYLIVISTNQSFPQIDSDSKAALSIYLYFAFVCVGVAHILVVMRTLTAIQLQKQQKQILRSSIFQTKRLLNLFLECFILLLQPYPFLMDVKFKTQNSFQNYIIEYPINDLLAIFSFSRVYVILRTILILSPYMSNRSHRLCKMYGCKANFSYSLKSMFKQHPLLFICTVYFTSVCLLAYIVYLAERQLAIQTDGYSQVNTPLTYLNALWLVLITTTTVGYGEYSPNTPLGRVIIMFVAIWGTLIVSLMVVVVSNMLSMQKTQVKTAKILNKLELRLQLSQKAEKVVGYFLLINLAKNLGKSSRNQLCRKLKKSIRQFSKVKKWIKQISEFDQIQDQVATHFLKLNSDIEILNRNQYKIIEYIHSSFKAKQKYQLRPSNIIAQTDCAVLDEEGEKKEPDQDRLFVSMLRQKIRQKQQ